MEKETLPSQLDKYKQIKYHFYYSGPLIFRSRLIDQDLLKFIGLCKKDKKLAWNKQLAGLIKEEYRIKDQIALRKILDPYLMAFKKAYLNWYNGTYKEMFIVQAWVNFMKANESNPIHTHNDCDFTSVFYLNLPKNFKKERENTITSGAKPGDINLLVNAQETPYYINMPKITPAVGDFFIFPAALPHYVNGFKSKGERISVSVNFKIKGEKNTCPHN